MKKLLIGLTLLASMSAFSHEMPDNVKKTKIIKILNDSFSAGGELEGFSISSSPTNIKLLSFLKAQTSMFFKFAGTGDFARRRDQDLGGVHIKLTGPDKIDYTLECVAETVESYETVDFKSGSFLYSLSLFECDLNGEGTYKNHDIRSWRRAYRIVEDMKDPNISIWKSTKY